jgi:hypothetical protein
MCHWTVRTVVLLYRLCLPAGILSVTLTSVEIKRPFAYPCYMWSQSYVNTAVITIKKIFYKTNIFTPVINRIFQAIRLDPVAMQGSLKTARQIVQTFEIILKIICVA